MKRTRITLAELAAHDNLALAAWKAARGKRTRRDVQEFFDYLDAGLKKLGQDILNATVPYGRYRAFHVQDPKRRLIHAACFEDRVLHHAIMNLAEPTFERALVPSTFACRPGRGVHRAVAAVQRNLQRFPWFAQVDIESYFPRIDHACLKGLLAARFKGPEFQGLLGRIIDSHESSPGKGLPIGSLTSQHFANFYLDGADRLLLADRRVCAHVRYMDDTLWWGRTKADVQGMLQALANYLDSHRGLSLKANVQINRSRCGVAYCGYRVTPGAIRLSPRKRRRYGALRRDWERAWAAGDIDEGELQRGYDAVYAITLHADSLHWRRQQLVRHPSLYPA